MWSWAPEKSSCIGSHIVSGAEPLVTLSRGWPQLEPPSAKSPFFPSRPSARCCGAVVAVLAHSMWFMWDSCLLVTALQLAPEGKDFTQEWAVYWRPPGVGLWLDIWPEKYTWFVAAMYNLLETGIKTLDHKVFFPSFLPKKCSFYLGPMLLTTATLRVIVNRY